MSQKPKFSEPIIPEPRACPRCGHSVLLGEIACGHCGYNMQSPNERLKGQPAHVVSIILFGMGIFVSLAATGLSGLAQLLVFVFGMGFIISGGLYYAYDLLFLNSDDRRRKP